MRLFKIGLLVGSLLASLLATRVYADPVTLRFWVAWDPQQADAIAATKQIEAYEQAHPNIKIDIQNIAFGALHDKLITSIAGGDAPDVSWGLIEWLGELNRMNALADLTPYAAKWPDRAQIYPNALDAVTIDGKLMALPHYLGIRGLLYHEDMLQKAGIATPPKTWDELVTDSQKIKQATGKYGFGIAGTGVRAPQELLMYLAQNNATLAKRMPDGKYRNTWGEDPKELANAAQVFAFYKTLQDKQVIAPEASSWGWEEEDTNFSLGQYAMVVDGSWMKNRAEQNPDTMKDVKIVAPPYGQKPATFFEINPFFVYKGKHQQEAWDFASFMLSKGYQSAVHGERSPRMDVVSQTKWGKDFTGLAPTGVGFPPVALGSITRAMEESIGRVLLKKEDPQSVATWLSKAVNRALRQSGELSGN
ncbi:ABC transporter substrate-binding protein [Pararobbsia silviterrae]|uniref:Sugar ABC transporter substrate-binding protein n=1 Tax=Pararobbsia silviterrae TaxID=1792498 RepID=A0A494XDY9_9BURK|nr:sugar ABC transporter substrate-binding protein [Pararobbsia silviterrae]RKP46676.1 sugar ABC transporter substrate-binding protein [Pararobbsia silviterrae]